MSRMADELLEERARIWEQAKALLDHAVAQNRDLTAAESHSYDRMTSDLDSLQERANKLREDERQNNAAADKMYKLTGGGSSRASLSPADKELEDQFRAAVRDKTRAPIDANAKSDEIRSGYQPGIERRATIVTSTGGGLRPTSFFGMVQQNLVESSAILRAGSTVLTTETGETMLIPRQTALSAAGIVAEAAAIPFSEPTLGTVPLGAYKFAFLISVSQELAADTNFDLLPYLARQAGTALGNGWGSYAITGTGTNQPTGILTGATLGVTGATGTATSFGAQGTTGQGGDVLLDLIASLAEPYSRSESAAFLMRNATLNIIRKLKDTTNNYVFSTDVVPGSGAAGSIFGRPVFTDPNMPAVAASAKSVLFGDVSTYWTRQTAGIRFERSDEFQFQNDLITFKAVARIDSASVDTSAMKWFAHSAS